MNLFTYFEDHSIRCLSGSFAQHTYQDLISSRRENLGKRINRYYDNKLNQSDLGTIGFQRLMILNKRFEQWDYPVICLHVKKSHHVTSFFEVSKGWNKIYANFIARRNAADMPVLVINYGKITTDIVVEKDIYNDSDLEKFVGCSTVLMHHSYREIDKESYLTIHHIRDNKVSLSEVQSVINWLEYLKSIMNNRKIQISIVDNHHSEISNSNDFFQLIDLPQYGVQIPEIVERTTHIREYKNLLRNKNEEILNFTLVTNKQIKSDLFDIIWFLQDHASDYVSEDRSYSILGPGAFRADSVLPGSEL
jgi:hypothetical protein